MHASMRQTIALCATAGVLLGAGCADDRKTSEKAKGAGGKQITLRYSSPIPVGITNMQIQEWWNSEIERRTEGRVKVAASYAGALYGSADTAPAISDRSIDMGVIGSHYTPSLFPLTAVVELPFISKNLEVVQNALLRTYDSSKLLQEEYTKQNIKPLMVYGVGAAATMTKKQITKLQDLDGLTLRAIGFSGNALDALGVTPVTTDSAEVYEAVQRGVVDGIGAVVFDGIPSQKWLEVAPHVLDSGYGVYAEISLAINLDTWASLPKDVQGLVEQVSTEAMDRLISETMKVEKVTCDTIKAQGGTVTIASEEDVRRWRDIAFDKIVGLWKKRGSGSGLSEDVLDEFLSSYLATVQELEAGPLKYEPGMESCAKKIG
jgi:TRAP-type C4-dicarboxylate transport system substrate-binding protein